VAALGEKSKLEMTDGGVIRVSVNTGVFPLPVVYRACQRLGARFYLWLFPSGEGIEVELSSRDGFVAPEAIRAEVMGTLAEEALATPALAVALAGRTALSPLAPDALGAAPGAGSGSPDTGAAGEGVRSRPAACGPGEARYWGPVDPSPRGGLRCAAAGGNGRRRQRAMLGGLVTALAGTLAAAVWLMPAGLVPADLPTEAPSRGEGRLALSALPGECAHPAEREWVRGSDGTAGAVPGGPGAGRVVLGDLTGDGTAEAVVLSECLDPGGGLAASTLYLYALEAEHLRPLGVLSMHDLEALYRAAYPDGRLWPEVQDLAVRDGVLAVTVLADGQPVRPERAAVLELRWDGTQALLAAPPQVSALTPAVWPAALEAAGPVAPIGDGTGYVLQMLDLGTAPPSQAREAEIEALVAVLRALPRPAPEGGVLAAAAKARARDALKAGRAGDAVQGLEPWIEAAPGDADLRNLLAHAYLLQGDSAAAERQQVAALALGPERGPAWANLAQVYLKMDDRARAVASLGFAYRFSRDRALTDAFLAALVQGEPHRGRREALQEVARTAARAGGVASP
jgi:tetratricopeptide (TPR) repeat protein